MRTNPGIFMLASSCPWLLSYAEPDLHCTVCTDPVTLKLTSKLVSAAGIHVQTRSALNQTMCTDAGILMLQR